MAKKSQLKNAKDKRDSGGYVAIPFAVLNGAAYLGLNAYARMLLLDMSAQYRGNNNGDLCAPWKLMHPRGWNSEATLNKAKQALLKSGLIVETRKGARPNKCSLYALTWFALDDCSGKLEISAQSFPRGAYKLKDRSPAIVSSGRKNASLTTADVATRTG